MEKTLRDEKYIATGLVATMEGLNQACGGLISNGHIKIAKDIVTEMKRVRTDMKFYMGGGIPISGDYMGKNNLDIAEYAEKIKRMEETQ